MPDPSRYLYHLPALLSTAVALSLVAAPAGAESDWLAINFFWTDASATMIHDPETGLLISEHGADCAVSTIDRPRLLASESFEFGVDRWTRVELADPSYDTKTFVHEVMGDKAVPEGSWVEGVLVANTPPASCDREVQYRIARSKGCTIVSAVPCSAQQRERLAIYVKENLSGELPPPLDDQSLKRARSIVPADLEFLIPGLPVATVLTEFGRPRFYLPRFPDGFSLEYNGSAALGDDISVLVDFSRERKIVGVRRVKQVD